jgi:excisionase family DNA binding protein
MLVSVGEMQQVPSLPPLLTVQELADFLHVGKNVAYEQCHHPDFPVVRIGKQLRIPRDALMSWLESQAGLGSPPTPVRCDTSLASARK